MAPIPWTSAHMRTQSPHRMHLLASRTRLGVERSNGTLVSAGREAHLVHAEAGAQVLQLALAVLDAGRAVAVVVGQQQLQHHLADVQQPRGVGLDLHAVGRRRRARAEHAAALVLDHAHPAGAVDAQLGVVAEGGQIDAGLAHHLQQVALAFDGTGMPSMVTVPSVSWCQPIDRIVDGHRYLSSTASKRQVSTQAPQRAHLSWSMTIRLLDLARDGTGRAGLGAPPAALAQVSASM